MFIFNGISSDDMGLVVTKLPPIEISQREVEEINIDGKDGTYTILKDYKTSTKRIEVHYEGDSWDKLSSWLQGTGELVLGNLKDRYYKAYIKGSIPLEQIINNKLSKFIITFVCQPFSYFLDNKPLTFKVGENTFFNFGTVYCEPIIEIEGNGAITIVTLNEDGTGETYKLTNVVGKIVIDSVNKLCYKDKTNESNKLTGNYPVMKTRKNTITITGTVTKVNFIPNMRYLI